MTKKHIKYHMRYVNIDLLIKKVDELESSCGNECECALGKKFVCDSLRRWIEEMFSIKVR